TRRDNSPTDVCKRWSHQSALVNGTLYIYGGRAIQSGDQTDNEWNNDFLTLDLTKTWQIGSPSFNGMPQPSGPPAVANGYLWNSYDSLFLYGGEFSDSPVESPVPFALWEYDIGSSSWKEHNNPQTSAGTNSEDANQPVQRVAEGAGVNVPGLGRGWYFGGHEDFLTTAGWSITVAREYVRSLLEYTFPGSTNSGVSDLSGGKTAGSDGVWRNVTNGGLQETGGFTERADGILLYIPGFGKQGILLALAGGTNTTFTQMNVIDVFDIDSSKWYKQATSGPTPGIRVNPCAAVAAAPDGSSYNVYMFAGQNLQPYKSQTEYQDMWILTVPSFTWINVSMDNQAVPYGRSGHTCNIWDGQMVVVGGYIGNDIPCESPGVYVFNMSSLQWGTQFTALSSSDSGSSDSGSSNSNSGKPAGLEGSYGYVVPEAVISVIGGNSLGAATVTAPVQSATDGPLATGKPITYTITGPSGAIVTETGSANPGSVSSSNNNGGSGGPNIGAIVAGVVAGILAIVAGYLAFCAWVYRKQLQLYKHHVAMAQQAAADPSRAEKAGFFVPPTPSKNSSDRRSAERSAQSAIHSHSGSGGSSGSNSNPAQAGATHSSNSDAGSSTENLLAGLEPTFVGVLLNPKRSLRIVNRD
ncbi:hypothetical protein NA57DRAFT_10793, partial [Rhizodiscina lignyota]